MTQTEFQTATEYRGPYKPVTDQTTPLFQFCESLNFDDTLSELRELTGKNITYTPAGLSELDQHLDSHQAPGLEAELVSTFLGNYLCATIPSCSWKVSGDHPRALQMTETLEWPLDGVISKKLYNEKKLLESATKFMLTQATRTTSND